MGTLCLCEAWLVFWVVILTRSDAEQTFFLQHNDSRTWDDAQSHCQLCFRDLATVMPNTTYVIAKMMELSSSDDDNVSSGYWIGLRKYLPLSNLTDDYGYNSSGGPDVAWSRWANGDPLAFQNWYPGWPKFKVDAPQISCCSCSCTCPAATGPSPTGLYDVTTDGTAETGYVNQTDASAAEFTFPTVSGAFGGVSPALPVGSQCEKSPMVFPKLPDPNKDYVEDSCVAMLPNGAWVEKPCTDLLPFICYDDRFYGNASVSSVTTSSAVLSWEANPSNPSHYRVNVNGSDVNETSGLTYTLEGLLAGSRYNVTVFAVKCDRDLDDPQKVTFYTVPSKVTNISVTTQTLESITLNWIHPDQNVDLYSIQCEAVQNNSVVNRQESKVTSAVVGSLTPGSQYNFTIWSRVSDASTSWSEPATILAYTRPGRVSNLQQTERNSSSVNVAWSQPIGGFTGYSVIVVHAQNGTLFYNQTQTLHVCTVGELPSGTKVNITVTVLGNDGLVGEAEQTVGYTAPDPVSNLTLTSDSKSLNVTWDHQRNSYTNFSLQYWPSADPTSNKTTTNLWYNISGLNSATNYTVTVWSVVDGVQSSPQSRSYFTLPVPPANVTAQSHSTNALSFTWDPPKNMGKNGSYRVNLTSPHWKQTKIDVTQNTNYNFSDLKSGSNYMFEVKTLAGIHPPSDPATTSAWTDLDPVNISLAIMCSSAISLYCGESSARDTIYNTLNITMDSFGLGVIWNLTNHTQNIAP